MSGTDAILRVRNDERAVIVGRTGSGKTTLARQILSRCYNVIAYDVKGEIEIEDAIIITNPERLSHIRLSGRSVVYRPSPEFWGMDYVEGFFKWVYMKRNCTLYVDEMYAVMEGNRSANWFRAILTRGRSLKIRTIACTQRPFSIPLSLLSESDKRYMFELSLQDDRKRMSELMGDEVLNPLPVKYAFYFYDAKTGGRAKVYRLGRK
jgi:ABC-type dipeptide/oligopeptide/nickel transport system ATPase component